MNRRNFIYRIFSIGAILLVSKLKLTKGKYIYFERLSDKAYWFPSAQSKYKNTRFIWDNGGDIWVGKKA